PDGHALPVPQLLATLSAIARVVGIPVSADIEGGYASDPVAVGETVARVVDAGAAGINLEDGTASPDLLCAKIEHSKRAAARHGVALFITAPTAAPPAAPARPGPMACSFPGSWTQRQSVPSPRRSICR